MEATKRDQPAIWAAAIEFLVVIGASFGYLIWIGTSGATTNSFSNDRLLWLIAYEAVVLLSVGAFLRCRRWKPSDFGPRPRWTDLFWGLYLFAASVLALIAVHFVAFSLLTGQAARPSLTVTAHLPILLAAALVNPVFEETLVCAYVITALRRMHLNPWLAVGASVAIRASYHIYQGPTGVLQIAALGVVFGVWYARTRRLMPVILVHAVFDLGSVLQP